MIRFLFRRKVAIGGASGLVLILVATSLLLAQKSAAEAARHFSPGSGWTIQTPFPGVVFWTKDKDDAEASMVTVVEYPGKVDVPPPTDQEFIDQTARGRKLSERLSGDKYWKITGVERETCPSGPKVILRGSYTDAAGERVAFEEWHFFAKQGYADLVYTQKATADGGTADRRRIRATLDGYVPFGGTD